MSTFKDQHDDAIQFGEGYANLTDDSSFKGRIAVYADWVIVRNSDSQYTVPRRRIDFINWKEVSDE